MGFLGAIVGQAAMGIFGSIFGHSKRKKARAAALKETTDKNVEEGRKLDKVARKQAGRRQASSLFNPNGEFAGNGLAGDSTTMGV